eukprot:c22137_g1_i1 orf=445-1050(+)
MGTEQPNSSVSDYRRITTGLHAISIMRSISCSIPIKQFFTAISSKMYLSTNFLQAHRAFVRLPAYKLTITIEKIAIQTSLCHLHFKRNSRLSIEKVVPTEKKAFASVLLKREAQEAGDLTQEPEKTVQPIVFRRFSSTIQSTPRYRKCQSLHCAERSLPRPAHRSASNRSAQKQSPLPKTETRHQERKPLNKTSKNQKTVG